MAWHGITNHFFCLFLLLGLFKGIWFWIREQKASTFDLCPRHPKGSFNNSWSTLLYWGGSGECGRPQHGSPNQSGQVGWNMAPSVHFCPWCSHSFPSCCCTSFLSSTYQPTFNFTISNLLSMLSLFKLSLHSPFCDQFCLPFYYFICFHMLR